MRRGFKCRKEVFEVLKKNYTKIVEDKYDKNYLKGIKNFDSIAEEYLRSLLADSYSSSRSRDQAWRTCKGALYEYAVFKYLEEIIEHNEFLKSNFILSTI